MKAIGALVGACLVFASSAAVAQTRDRASTRDAPPTKAGGPAEAIYSYCVTRFEGGGQKEVFPSSIARTADTISLRRYVEYRATTGANSSVAKDANLTSECGSSRDQAEAKKRRDLERSRATNLGFLLKPEVVYH
jgi:hypothetical protein